MHAQFTRDLLFVPVMMRERLAQVECFGMRGLPGIQLANPCVESARSIAASSQLPFAQ